MRWTWGCIALALVLASSWRADAAVVGQWVWCDADRRALERARVADPALMPGVLVATISVAEGAVVQRLGFSPSSVKAPAVALVVRFDERFHAFWSLPDADAARATVGAKLRWIVERAAAMGVSVAEVQLDYDCPTRRLAAWASLVAALGRDALRGHPVWITSIPAHMTVAGYGDAFRDVVAGHILQLYDVGPTAPASDAARLAALVRRQRMPFRVGVAAFERVRGAARVTDHGAWLEAAGVFADDPRFGGLWIFPGGQRWSYAR